MGRGACACRRSDGGPGRRSRGPLVGALRGAALAPLSIALLGAGPFGCGRPAFPVPVPSVRAPAGSYEWQLPAGFPRPRVLGDNPMTAEKVELGRRLFYDSRLSVDGRVSCSSCHRQELAFTDGRARAVGATGELHPRSAMTLTNVAYNVALTWADPRFESLERQLEMPLFNTSPVEMGLTGIEVRVEGALRADRRTSEAFGRAFPRDGEPVTLANAGRALASFERTLISGESAYDRWLFHDDRGALSLEARRGMRLFFSDRLGCSGCHGGFNLSGPVAFAGSPPAQPAFHDTNLGERGDPGLGAVTGLAGDVGRFRAPTLRNVEVTAPYMHDGSVASLEEVLDHYAAGGRGRPVSANRSDRLQGFSLSPAERAAVVAFLRALTDRAFLSDPRFGPPPAADERTEDGPDVRGGERPARRMVGGDGSG